MDRRLAQLRLWAETGEHRIQVSYDQPASESGETVVSEHSSPPVKDAASAVASEAATSSDSTTSSTPDKLVGTHGDWLIPEPSQITRVYEQGRRAWTQLVAEAWSLPPNMLPTGVGDPIIMLKDVPSLPPDMSKGGLEGQPVWHLPEPQSEGEDDLESSDSVGEKDFPINKLYGVRKYFRFSFPTPITCNIRSKAQIEDGNLDDCSGNRPLDPPGLFILTLCWSYILSIRLWELQGKIVTYTRHVLRTEPRENLQKHDESSNSVKIDLGRPASRQLVAWLCAILASKPGWAAKGAKVVNFTPWATLCPDDAHFGLYADEPAEVYQQERPPSSAEAVELLVEFCSLFGLGNPQRRRGRPRKDASELSPVTSAFLAALALPFYRYVELQPQFSLPVLKRSRQANQVNIYIAQHYFKDLTYYMTLSADPRGVGSVIWSIFWQPDIECNLVSPWLSSTLGILKPIIDAGDLDLLVRAFAIRRPRVALWWLGIFLLGSPSISAFVLRYLDLLEEQWGFGSMALPDTTSSVWTGSAQTFLDEETTDVYRNLKDAVPVTELLKCRYNLRLQDEYRLPLAWRPVGSVPKEKIEVDLWPWLESGHTRTYKHWVWWVRKGGVVRKDIQRGFRRDTGRFVPGMEGRPLTNEVEDEAVSDTTYDGDIGIEPSLKATTRMVTLYMDDIAGDGYALVDVEAARKHPWLKDLRGWECLG